MQIIQDVHAITLIASLATYIASGKPSRAACMPVPAMLQQLQLITSSKPASGGPLPDAAAG